MERQRQPQELRNEWLVKANAVARQLAAELEELDAAALKRNPDLNEVAKEIPQATDLVPTLERRLLLAWGIVEPHQDP